MSEKKKFLLRLNEETYEAVEQWAADDLRNVNAQFEFILAQALRSAGIIRKPKEGPESTRAD